MFFPTFFLLGKQKKCHKSILPTSWDSKMENWQIGSSALVVVYSDICLVWFNWSIVDEKLTSGNRMIGTILKFHLVPLATHERSVKLKFMSNGRQMIMLFWREWWGWQTCNWVCQPLVQCGEKQIQNWQNFQTLWNSVHQIRKY